MSERTDSGPERTPENAESAGAPVSAAPARVAEFPKLRKKSVKLSYATQLPEGATDLGHTFARWLGRRFFAFPYRVRAHNLERIPATGGIVVVANHSSFVDGPLIFGVIKMPRRMVFLIKNEMFKGLVGAYLRSAGQLGVKRGEPDRATLIAAQKVLKAGGTLGVFPEGTRGDGDMASAQQGAAWLARTSGALIVPMAVRGARRPEGSRRRFLPVVDILVGEPFEASTAKGRQGLAEATEQVRDRLVALVAELDTRRSNGEAR